MTIFYSNINIWIILLFMRNALLRLNFHWRIQVAPFQKYILIRFKYLFSRTKVNISLYSTKSIIKPWRYQNTLRIPELNCSVDSTDDWERFADVSCDVNAETKEGFVLLQGGIRWTVQHTEWGFTLLCSNVNGDLRHCTVEWMGDSVYWGFTLLCHTGPGPRIFRLGRAGPGFCFGNDGPGRAWAWLCYVCCWPIHHVSCSWQCTHV